MRLIDADKLKFKHKCHYGEHTTRPYTLFCISFEEIQKAPTIQAVPIEVLDNIRAEIEQNAYPIVHGVNNHEKGMTLYGILQVIDKHRKEQE